MKANKQQILLVDDDQDLCLLLSEYLSSDGFSVETVHSGEQAIEQVLGSRNLDAMVLDVMMPGLSGFDVLQHIRQHREIPVIMLTGRGDDVDRIVGLEMGADDYLGKPCNPRELAARLRAVLRRSQATPSPSHQGNLNLHGIILNKGNRNVEIKGEALALTSAEFNVLQLLMESAGQVLSKELLTKEALQRELTAHDRSIDVHVSRIRQKLNACGLENIIKSIRGIGYQMLSTQDDKD